jgi:hypothetical protein
VTPARLLKDVERELARRGRLEAAKPRSIDLDRICHRRQASLVRTLVLRKVRNVCALAGRQSGKSHGGALACALIASDTPQVNVVYVTSTYASCKRMAFLPAVEHNRVHALGGDPNYAEMTIGFPNASRVYFMGADTDRLIDRLRGIPNLVLVLIDEAGIYGSDKLKTMIEAVRPGLRPMSGTLCVMGTPSLAGRAGTWFEITENAHFEQHRFDYRDNDRVPSFAAVETLIDDELAAMGLTRESAYFKREYLALFEVDLSESAFRYDRARAGYEGDPPEGLSMFAVGIDPGTRDRTAIQVWGWGEQEHAVYHVYEWVTERNAGTTWAQIGAELGRIRERWDPHAWYYDAGGSKMTLDLFARDYGIPVIKAAVKADLPGQVSRFADLLAKGQARIRIGSALEHDLQRAQWDRDARIQGRYSWSAICHPDAADAARYGLQAYFDSFRPPLTDHDRYLEGIRRAEQLALENRAVQHEYSGDGEFQNDEYSDVA